MNETEHNNTAATVRDMMTDLTSIEAVETGNDRSDLTVAHLISVPHRRKVEDVTPAIQKALETIKPYAKKGIASFQTLDSFIDWTMRFAGKDTVLFANASRSNPGLTSVIDYHAAGETDLDPKTGDANARHCRHQGAYRFPISEEWKIWNEVAQRTLTKAELGEFIEENAKDIIDPTPALLGADTSKAEPWEIPLIEVAAKLQGRYGQFSRLMEMSRHFEIYETSNLVLKRNPDDGTTQMTFENENKDAEGRPLSIPNLFLIAIPIFDQGVCYRLPVRFSFKKNGSGVSFRLTPHNPNVAFYDAIREAVNIAEEKTELPTFYGSPET